MTHERSNIPIVETAPPTEQDIRLRAMIESIETNQLTFLDEASKSIIERISTLLAVVFAVMAFGDSFPPPYLNDPATRYLTMGVVLLYLAAMFAAMRAIAPRSYKLFRHNLTAMRAELDHMIEHKYRAVWLAGLLFWIGTFGLVTLVGYLVLFR